MILRPRNFKFKNKFKHRKFNNFKNSPFKYGNAGLLLIKNLFLNSKQMQRFKLFFKKLNKKAEKTSRYLWFKTFPFHPLSKKPQGLRMGKGTGKLILWYSKHFSGSILIEVKNIRVGRVFYFFKQFQYKLSIPIKLIFNHDRNLLYKTYNFNTKIILNFF